MTHYYFCTYFDRNYCDKGLALYESIIKHVQSFTLYILCLDEDTYTTLTLLEMPSVELIRLSELEVRNPLFHETKTTRSLIEYYFTCTPVFIRDVITEFPEIDIITYLDADLYFFSSIDPVYEEMGSASILIVEHRFPPELQDRLIYGIFNVGYLSFRNNDEGRRCLDDWSGDCIVWCYDRVEGERFADQKYLDTWPEKYSGLIVSQNIGLNVAPWNVSSIDIKVINDKFVISSKPLILYHFHALKIEILHKYCYCFDNQLRFYYGYRENGLSVTYNLYCIYIIHLIENIQRIMKLSGGKNYCGNIRNMYPCQKASDLSLFTSLIKGLKKMIKDSSKNDIILVPVLNTVFFPIPLWNYKKRFSYCIRIGKLINNTNTQSNK